MSYFTVSNRTNYHQHETNKNEGKVVSKNVDGRISFSNRGSFKTSLSENNQIQKDVEPTSPSVHNPLHNTLPSKEPLSIHIEVDIDPPPDEKISKRLSENEMKNLGLPSHHVHWSLPPVLSLSRTDEDLAKEGNRKNVDDIAHKTLNDKINEVARARNKLAYKYDSKEQRLENDKQQTRNKNLLAPSDIHITYSISDDSENSGEYENDLSININSFDDDGSRDSDIDSWTFGSKSLNQDKPHIQNHAWQRDELSDSSNVDSEEEIEPPRALPSRIVKDVPQGVHHKNGDLSDRFPHTDTTDTAPEKRRSEAKPQKGSQNNHITQQDYEDSLCDLDCGMTGGNCFLEKEHHYKDDRNFVEKDWVKIHKRCLCPLGKQGKKCENGKNK